MSSALRHLLLCCLVALPCRAERVTVFAAASLTGALQEFWSPQRHPDVQLSFGGSSMLARQIAAGAPADLYLSASSEWMDYLQQHNHVDAAARVDLLGNRLVLIAPRHETLRLTHGAQLAEQFSGRLAIADPAHVPAGVYARQVLQALGWWTDLADRLAPAGDVRSALTWVERGECAAGIVYSTDAAASARVEVVMQFADSLHAPIRYPAAIVSGRVSARTRRHLDTLRSPAARALFQRHGFVVLSEDR